MGSNRLGTGNGGTTTRCSFSLNTEVYEDLKFIADAIGVSRSAFLGMLLGESLPMLRENAENILRRGYVDAEETIAVAKTYSAKSKDLLDARIAQLRGSTDGHKPS